MEIEITNDSKNALLGRREITFLIMEENKTPSKDEVKEALCKKLSLSPENTVIVRIDQDFGVKRGKGQAHAYEKKEDIQKYEQRRLINRWTKKKGAKPAEAKPAEKKE